MYYINICSPVNGRQIRKFNFSAIYSDTKLLGSAASCSVLRISLATADGCAEDSAVCVKRSDGSVNDLASVTTQKLLLTGMCL